MIVHRLLAAAIGISPLPKAYEDKAAMRALCDNMNRRHLMSQLAGRAWQTLCCGGEGREPYNFEVSAHRLGMLMTVDGSDDDRLQW